MRQSNKPSGNPQFEAIFSKSNYLLSDELKQEWIKQIRDDEYFAMYEAKKKGSGATSYKLGRMHELALKEYSLVKSEFEKTTGISLNKKEA